MLQGYGKKIPRSTIGGEVQKVDPQLLWERFTTWNSGRLGLVRN